MLYFFIEIFLANSYRGENNFFLHFWCCNFQILDPLMLAEYSPSINPEHERVRACARTPKPEPEHQQKHQVPREHRASMCSDPSLGPKIGRFLANFRLNFGKIMGLFVTKKFSIFFGWKSAKNWPIFGQIWGLVESWKNLTRKTSYFIDIKQKYRYILYFGKARKKPEARYKKARPARGPIHKSPSPPEARKIQARPITNSVLNPFRFA